MKPLWRQARDALIGIVAKSSVYRELQTHILRLNISPRRITYDKDGIDSKRFGLHAEDHIFNLLVVHFLNSERNLEGCTDTNAVERLFDEVRPRSSTPTAIRMDDILRPYVDRVEEAKGARTRLPKPMVSLQLYPTKPCMSL